MKKSYADYHINPARKKKRRAKSARRKNSAKRTVRRARRAKRKMRNPVPYGIVLVNSPRRKKARRAKRRRNAARRAARRRPTIISSVPTKNPSSMKTRRRGRRRHRNASRRRTSRRRSSMSLRNPIGRRSRRRSRRMRNPAVSEVVGDIFSSENLTLGAGIVAGQVGTNIVINKLRMSQMAANGSLPGLNPAAPSPMGIMLWKLGISVGVGYLLRNQAPRFARGLILGGVSGAMSDLLVQSRALQMIPGAAGAGRYFGPARGAGAYLPGTSTRFTGPGSRYLVNGGRSGVSARVTPGLVNQLPVMVNPAFGN